MGQSPTYYIPRLDLSNDIPLRWSEWLAIALFNTGALALGIETVLRVMATIWFGEPDRALLPLGSLWLALLAAALVARACIVVPALRPVARGISVVAVVVLALVLIRVQVFPHLALGDLRWLGSFSELGSLEAERPHAELGLIVLSAILWLLADGVARNGGELGLRRANFLGFFWVLVGAVLLSLFASRGLGALDLFIALALPFYVLGGLLMLAQVRLAEMRYRTSRAGVSMARALWIWRLVTVGLIVFSLVLVFIAAAIFYGDSYGQLIGSVNTIWEAILTVITFLVGVIATPFFLIASLFNTSPPGQTTPARPVALPPEAPLSPSAVHLTYGVVLVVVAVVIVLVLAYRFWRTLRQPEEDTFTEMREHLAPERFAREPQPAFNAASEPTPPGSVRAVYRTLLRRMTKVGLTRDPDETPAEYAARLSPHLGGAPADDPIVALQELTTDYHNERYGGTLPTPTLFARAQAALRRMLRRDE